MLPRYLPNLKPSHLEQLPLGLRAYRVHDSGAEWFAANRHKPRLRKGGRFDAQQGSPGAWYISTTRAGSFSEMFFRADDTTPAPEVRLGDVARLSVSELELVGQVTVVTLEDAVFQALRMPPSITSTWDRHSYAISRQAGEDIRDSIGALAPDCAATGIGWRCARNQRFRSIVCWVDAGWTEPEVAFAPIETTPVLDHVDLLTELCDLYDYALLR